MRALLLSITIALLLFTTAGYAQTIDKTLKISSKDFNTTPGTPRVVRNPSSQQWLVLWRQHGSSAKLSARLVDTDGTLRTKKTLAKKLTSASHSFDAAVHPATNVYLIAFETSKGLQVQRFTSALKKDGSPQTIESGVTGSNPRLAFNDKDSTFLILWVSENGTTLKSAVLDESGRITGTVLTVVGAKGASQFTALNLERNSKTGKLLALLTESDAAGGKLVGYRIDPDGSLQKSKALTFSPDDPDLNSITGDSSFSDSGTGFVFWSDDDSVKRRKVSSKGGIASSTQSLPGEADDNSEQTSILFDSRNNQFVSSWTVGNRVKAMTITSGGDVKQNPFDVATSDFTSALNSESSFDDSTGNTLVVWEDSTEDAGSGSSSAKFRIRGALFFFQGGGGGGGTTHNVTIGDNFFSPSSLTIAAGDTVVWSNNGFVSHTSTSGSPSNAGSVWDSGTITRGGNFSFRFNTPGTFQYFCRIHGTSMTGTITVQ